MVISCDRGMVQMPNTFGRRLELLREEGMADVHDNLFGKNPNCKFDN